MKLNRKYKIAFVSSRKIINQNKLSGTAYYISEAVKKYIGEVNFIEPLLPQETNILHLLSRIDIIGVVLWNKLIQQTYRLLGKAYQWERTVSVSRAYARRLNRLFKKCDYDFIIADKGSIVIAYMKTDIPILYFSDTTFSLMVDYYPNYTNLSAKSLKQGHKIEKMAIDKAFAVLYRSKWAADSAIENYGADPQKIYVTLHGPNLDEKYIASHQKSYSLPHNSPCNLLLIGCQWYRKGCDTAIEATRFLRDEGIDARLIICGAHVPDQTTIPGYVKMIPFLKKNNDEDMKNILQLYKKASFLLMPSRAEAFGITALEACAFGVPVVASNTGGTPDIVQHNSNGILIDDYENPAAFASAIKNLYHDVQKYRALCVNARKFYEENATWHVWANKVKSVILKHELAKNSGIYQDGLKIKHQKEQDDK